MTTMFRLNNHTAIELSTEFPSLDQISYSHSSSLVAERCDKRDHLIRSESNQELESALRWFTQMGDKDDLRLLRQVRNRPPLRSENLGALADLAEKRYAESAGARNRLSCQVRDWISQLPLSSEEDGYRWLSVLGRVAAEIRSSQTTRGSLNIPALASTPTDLEKAMHRLLRSEHDGLRREVAYILGALGGAASVPALRNLVRPHHPPDVRAEAIDSLGKIGGPEATAILLEAAKGDADEVARAEAVDALASLVIATPSPKNKQRVKRSLRTIALHDLSPLVRQRAAKACAQ